MSEFLGRVCFEKTSRKLEILRLLTADPVDNGFTGEEWGNGPAMLAEMPVSSGTESSGVQHHDSGATAVGNVRLDEPGRLQRSIRSRPDSRTSSQNGCTSNEPRMDGEFSSDLGLALEAYEKWGLTFTEHLQGAFSFVIWDPRERRLIAVRDPFGREPLFAYDGPKEIAVASGINALRRLSSVSEEIDEARIADFLMFMHEDRGATFYNDIRRVPPGHLLVASRSGTRIRQYRTLSPSKTLDCQSDSEYEEAYRGHLFQAVRRSVRGGGRIATWLSGGLDSSSITCAAREVLPDERPISTFSLTFDAVPESDEREFAEAVHRTGGFDGHFVPGDEEGPLDIVDEAIGALGEPFMTPNLFTTVSLLRAARQAGVDTVLDGFLGDSVTGHGTTRLTELALTGQWLTGARELRAVAQELGPSFATYRNLLQEYVLGPLLAEPLRRGWRDLTRQPVGDETKRSVVQPDLLRRTGWEERVQAYSAARSRSPVRERAAHKNEVQSGNLRLAVETATRTARRFGISVRFPFADEDLISFCLALPSRQKCRNGWTRVVAREALSDILPGPVARRYGKASLGPVFRRALLELNREKLRSVVYDQVGEARAFIQPESVRTLLEKCVDGNASQDEVAVLWNAVVLTRWLTSRSELGEKSVTHKKKKPRSVRFT